MGQSQHGLLPVEMHRERVLLRQYLPAPGVLGFVQVEVVAAGPTAAGKFRSTLWA